MIWDEEQGHMNPARLQWINGRLVYKVAPPSEGSTMLGLLSAGNIEGAYEAALAERDVLTHLLKRLAFFGRLNWSSELRRVLDRPLKPSAPVLNEATYRAAQQHCVCGYLDSLITD